MAHDLELLTTSEMAEADRLTIAGGMPGIELMNAAGRLIAEQAMKMVPGGGDILVACGPGNNGGDGFVAAQLLKERGCRIRLILYGSPNQLSGDAALAAKIWSGEIAPLEDASKSMNDGADEPKPDLIIDALFGAGLSRDIEGAPADFIHQINQSKCPVLSVDMPSGIDGNSGQIRGVSVQATCTVTFFRKKPGHLLMPGRAHCGDLMLGNIGIRPSVINAIKPRIWANEPSLWRSQFPTKLREIPNGHKYTRGHALVVSGGMTQAGAARLAARGALRAGAGLVTLVSPKSAVLVNAMHLNAVMLTPFSTADDLAVLLSDKRKNAVLIGPGCGIGEATRANVAEILKCEAATVLDADALTSFAGRAHELFEAIKNNPARPVCMTPHEGEFTRLFGDCGLDQTITNPSKLDRARAAARISGATIILKGADTVIASPDGDACINQNAPPSLATAGSGDVLAGILTGLLAQKMPAFKASCAAVWLHGEAANTFGPGLISGLIAEDLTEMLPRVLQNLDEYS